MSVAAMLGVSDPEQGLLAHARERWPGWCEASPTLAVVDDLLELPAWIKANDAASVDEVLVDLARLASPSGGDDVSAAGALAWLLLPGAAALAFRMRPYSYRISYRIDEVVVSHLWTEVRGFAWQRLGKVAANVLMSVSREVRRDLGLEPDRDRTWARTVLLDPSPGPTTHGRRVSALDPDLAHLTGDLRVWDVRGDAQVPPQAAEELADVLDRAVGQRVIEARDRALLTSVAEMSDVGLRGICSRRVSVAVAARHGVSPATVRRRVRGSLEVLAATYQRIPA